MRIRAHDHQHAQKNCIHRLIVLRSRTADPDWLHTQAARILACVHTAVWIQRAGSLGSSANRCLPDLSDQPLFVSVCVELQALLRIALVEAEAWRVGQQDGNACRRMQRNVSSCKPRTPRSWLVIAAAPGSGLPKVGQIPRSTSCSLVDTREQPIIDDDSLHCPPHCHGSLPFILRGDLSSVHNDGAPRMRHHYHVSKVLHQGLHGSKLAVAAM